MMQKALNTAGPQSPSVELNRAESKEWALKLFSRSPLKQRKLKMLLDFCGDYSSKTCLDIGSDNGVISLLLRERGGYWYSGDLIPETVESIRGLVGRRVLKLDGGKTEFADNTFDLVVIVDFLEHIENDRGFITELYRILKPCGILVVNVPNPKEGLLRKLKDLIGQNDAAHGHLRPGYKLSELSELLGKGFMIERSASYSRFFSDLIDTVITYALDRLKKGGRGKKGSVVTGCDMARMKRSFKMYTIVYPVVACIVKLDDLFPFLHGNMLIARAKSLKNN